MKIQHTEFPAYWIHDDGRVWSSHTGIFLQHYLSSQDKGDDYYLAVKLCKDTVEKTFSVHRLVAEAFIANPDGLATVNHKDGNKQNNHVSNLEWMSQGDNKRHAFETGISEAWWKGEVHPRSTFTDSEVHAICYQFAEGKKPKDFCKSTTKLYQKLFRIYNRDNWKEVSKHYHW